MLLQSLCPHLKMTYSSPSGGFKCIWSSSQERGSQSRIRLKPQREGPWTASSRRNICFPEVTEILKNQLGTKYDYLYKPKCYVSDSPSLKFPTSLFKIKLRCFFFFFFPIDIRLLKHTQICHCLTFLWIYSQA